MAEKKKCNAKCEVYSRVCGYYRPVSNWNKGKREEFKERKTFRIALVLLVCLFFSGCGHNVIHYGDGVGFDAGLNPENYTVSLNLRYGKMLSAVTRDNVEIEMTGRVDANGTGGFGTNGTSGTQVGSDGTLKVKIGKQINGATADLLKAGADANKVLDLFSEKNSVNGAAQANKKQTDEFGK